MNGAEMCRPSIQFEKWKRLCLAIRVNEVWLATSEDNKVAVTEAYLTSLLEREDGRTMSEIVKHGVGKSGQSKTPGTAKLVVKEHSPTQTNSIQHVSKDVHVPTCLARRTNGHNIRTLTLYRPEMA